MKVKSCNALLPMLLVYINTYLKSVLRYKFLIFDTHHRVTPYIRQQDVRIFGYFSKPKREREQKHLERTDLECTAHIWLLRKELIV